MPGLSEGEGGQDRNGGQDNQAREGTTGPHEQHEVPELWAKEKEQVLAKAGGAANVGNVEDGVTHAGSVPSC